MKNIFWVVVFGLVFYGCGQASNPSQSETTPNAQGKKTLQVRQSVAFAKPEAPKLTEAIQYLNKGNIRQALKSMGEAITQNPDDSRAYLMLSETYLRIKRYEDAVVALESLLKREPDNGDARYLLAVSLGFMGRTEQAIESARKSVEIFQKERNAEDFKKSVALLRGLMESAGTQTAQ